MTPEIKNKIDQLIKDNRILLFMKGDREMPQCGFSNQVIQTLNSLKANYTTVNIMADPSIRSGIKEYSNWPTIPQLYVDGQFVGGCDIVMELHQRGQLKDLIAPKA